MEQSKKKNQSTISYRESRTPCKAGWGCPTSGRRCQPQRHRPSLPPQSGHRSLSGDSSEEVLPDVFSLLPLFADLSTFMIQQVIQFAKAIPAFRNLPMDDQISLLKGATLEVCQIQFNTVFNEETNAWQCGSHCYTIQDGALAGFQQIYLEPLLKFHISLRKLRLHEAEYVLLQALVLFYPGETVLSSFSVLGFYTLDPCLQPFFFPMH
uniref:NR LBD domain-containing protein n=1 Tax=Naja naja TaxID=35670 RepID=A0A8C6VLA9_NAJNA